MAVWVWYRTGTFSLPTNSSAVTGVLTAFLTGCKVGDAILLPSGALLEIGSIESNTALTLKIPYTGTAIAAGTAFVSLPLSPRWDYSGDLAIDVRNLLGSLASVIITSGQPISIQGGTTAMAYDPVAQVVYFKTGGVWGNAISIVGPAGTNGTNGSTILNGAGAPGAGVGVNGDYYLDTTNSRFYGPKASGAWPGTFIDMNGTAVRADIAQSFTTIQKAQARNNISAIGADPAAYLGLLTNPFMEISQEFGTTTTTISNQVKYVIDQVLIFSTGTSASSWQQVANPFASFAGFRRIINALRATITTAQSVLGTNEYLSITQNIEGTFWRGLGWGTADAAAIDVIAIVSTSVAGTYSLSLRNGFSNRSYVVPVVLAANTPTSVFATIPGDTAGVWATDTALAVQLWFTAVCGTTFVAPANNAWQTGNYIGVAGGVNMAATLGATLTIGYLNVFPSGVLPWTTATQVDLARLASMRRPYDEELRRCQRYWAQTRVSARITAPAAGYNLQAPIYFPVPMRVMPSGSLTAVQRSNVIAPVVYPSSEIAARIECASAAAGDAYVLADIVTLNARM